MIKRAVNLVEAGAIESALRVVSTERNGLDALEAALTGSLAGPFCNAIRVIAVSYTHLTLPTKRIV